MTTPINLNKFRKSKAKAKKRQTADENRVKFGRTKTEKNLEKARSEKARREIDSQKISDHDPDYG